MPFSFISLNNAITSRVVKGQLVSCFMVESLPFRGKKSRAKKWMKTTNPQEIQQILTSWRPTNKIRSIPSRKLKMENHLYLRVVPLLGWDMWSFRRVYLYHPPQRINKCPLKRDHSKREGIVFRPLFLRWHSFSLGVYNIHIYLEPQWPLFFEGQPPPKTRAQSPFETMVIWLPGCEKICAQLPGSNFSRTRRWSQPRDE